MSLLATCLFIPIRLPNLSFGVCFTCFAIFTSLLLYIILLAKQAFVYNQLIITPPPPFTIKQSRFVWEVVSFIEGVPSNHYNINPEKLKKHLKRKCERKRKISSTMMLKKLKKTQNHTT